MVCQAIKGKFSGFNDAFESQYNGQRVFAVTDSDLRSQLRTANVQHVVPRYEAFLATYAQVEFSSQPGKYIKYNAQVLEGMLNKFFDEMA